MVCKGARGARNQTDGVEGRSLERDPGCPPHRPWNGDAGMADP